MKIWSKMPLFIASWLALGSMLFWVPEPAQAAPKTEVSLTLQPEPPELDVSPGSSGIVTLTGEVYCLKYGPDEVKVTLIGSCNLSAVSVNPSTLVLRGTGGSEETRSFAFTTRIPMGYAADEMIPVTVNGFFSQGDLQYSIEPVSQVIDILPFYNISAEAPIPINGAPGDFVYFPIKITNAGNTQDTYEFIFDNLMDLCNSEWTVATITPKTFQPGQTKTIQVSAQIPQDAIKDWVEIRPFTLRIVSQQAAKEGRDVKYFVPLYVRVNKLTIPRSCSTFMMIYIILVPILLGTWGWKKVKNSKKSHFHPKDLYSELSMSMR